MHGCSPLEPEAELDHLPLPLGKRVERSLDVLAAQPNRGGVERRLGLLVLHEVTELRLLFLADRLLEETGSCAMRRTSRTSSVVISSSTAISSGRGSRPRR